jgi:alpha-tubulin suppressor-like RCC1 family protein
MTKSNFAVTSTDLDDILAPRNWFRSAGNKIFSAGLNNCGQLGNNSTTNRSSPVQEISTSGAWRSVSSGNCFANALKSNGTLWSWGINTSGQLGDRTVSTKCSPIQEITSSTNWCIARAGGNNSSAIKDDGTLWTWGSGVCHALGTGTLNNACSPVRENSSSANWSIVDVGARSFMGAIKGDGTLWSWGHNDVGQLGDNSTITRCSPVREVSSSTNWCFLSLGGCHSSAIKTDGSLWAWGNNCGAIGSNPGQLGDGTTVNKLSPVREISSSTDWKSVAVNCLSSQALKTDGSLWTWGVTNFQSVGSRCSPIQETTSAYNWYKHSVFVSSAAIKTDGTLWGWGYNICGLFGNNNTTTITIPSQLSIDTTWKDVDLGNWNMHAIKMSDTLC